MHEATSGWPTLIRAVADAPPSTADPVAWIREHVAKTVAPDAANARELLAATGLGGNTELSRLLRATFDQVVDLADGTVEIDELAEVIADLDYDANHTFANVAAVLGFTSTVDLLELLRVSGALLGPPDRSIAEPVLAAARQANR